MSNQKPMSDEEYTQTQQELFLLAALVRRLDVNGFLERIAHAEGLAPILDPTLSREAMPKLEIVKQVAYGAAQFQKHLPSPEDIERAENETKAAQAMRGKVLA